MSSLTDSTLGFITSFAVRFFITASFCRIVTAEAGRLWTDQLIVTARLLPRPRECTVVSTVQYVVLEATGLPPEQAMGSADSGSGISEPPSLGLFVLR
jgi:hypothetical protein